MVGCTEYRCTGLSTFSMKNHCLNIVDLLTVSPSCLHSYWTHYPESQHNFLFRKTSSLYPQVQLIPLAETTLTHIHAHIRFLRESIFSMLDKQPLKMAYCSALIPTRLLRLKICSWDAREMPGWRIHRSLLSPDTQSCIRAEKCYAQRP